MTLSASLERFLLGMEYPATKDDLLREATRDGLGDPDVALLGALPDATFRARRDVCHELSHADSLALA